MECEWLRSWLGIIRGYLYNSHLVNGDYQMASYTLSDGWIDDVIVVEIVKETIVVGRISFDGKSGRFCPGIPISLSLLVKTIFRNSCKIWCLL